MKALVLARGKGTRMERAEQAATIDEAQSRVADSGLKAMIPFRRPFLDYILSSLADAGCLDICLVIGREHDAVRDYYERTSPPERVRVAFAIQQQARGTADAVLSAESFAQDAPFLVLNADNYYPVDVLRALVALDGPGLPAFRRSTLIGAEQFDAERVRSSRVADRRRNRHTGGHPREARSSARSRAILATMRSTGGMGYMRSGSA